MKGRLITYRDPLDAKILRFLRSQFDFQSQTIVVFYKNCLEIEAFFKKLKQNFELGFFSDIREGIQI